VEESAGKTTSTTRVTEKSAKLLGLPRCLCGGCFFHNGVAGLDDREPALSEVEGQRSYATWSIFAAIMKSLSVSPSILCVQRVIPTLPHLSTISG